METLAPFIQASVTKIGFSMIQPDKESDTVRIIRDEIKVRVENLISDLHAKQVGVLTTLLLSCLRCKVL